MSAMENVRYRVANDQYEKNSYYVDTGYMFIEQDLVTGQVKDVTESYNAQNQNAIENPTQQTLAITDGTTPIPVTNGSKPASVILTRNGQIENKNVIKRHGKSKKEGSIIVSRKEGSVIMPQREGSVIIPRKEGSIIMPDRTGSVILRRSDGSIIVPRNEMPVMNGSIMNAPVGYPRERVIQRVVTSPRERMMVTPRERIVGAPMERMMTTPRERIVTAPGERYITTPRERIVTAPAERYIKTPRERIVTAPGERYITTTRDRPQTSRVIRSNGYAPIPEERLVYVRDDSQIPGRYATRRVIVRDGDVDRDYDNNIQRLYKTTINVATSESSDSSDSPQEVVKTRYISSPSNRFKNVKGVPAAKMYVPDFQPSKNSNTDSDDSSLDSVDIKSFEKDSKRSKKSNKKK